jgi:hypothetical protein
MSVDGGAAVQIRPLIKFSELRICGVLLSYVSSYGQLYILPIGYCVRISKEVCAKFLKKALHKNGKVK